MKAYDQLLRSRGKEHGVHEETTMMINEISYLASDLIFLGPGAAEDGVSIATSLFEPTTHIRVGRDHQTYISILECVGKEKETITFWTMCNAWATHPWLATR